MTWFKVDDGLHAHRKVLSIPRSGRAAAMGLWVLAGAWSADNLSDGRIPAYMVAELGCTQRNAKHLVDAGLWIEVNGDYQFHAWNEPGRQPTRADVEEARETERKRKAEYRSRVVSQRDSGGTPNGTDSGTPAGVQTPRPDPSRPVLSSGLGSQSANGRSEPAPGDGLDLARIATVIGAGTDQAWANRVVRQILDRAPANAVRDPQRYVEAAIRERPGDYRPTPQAPRVGELCDHGRERATCPWEAS